MENDPGSRWVRCLALYAGLGYEYRRRWIFRVGPYAYFRVAGDNAFFLLDGSPVQPWFGVSFGRAF